MEESELGASFWKVVVGVSIVVTASVIVASFSMLLDHDARLHIVESNRFTDQDARAMENRIVDQLPPEWLLSRLDQIDRRLERIEDANER
jgi:hypothetical protein